MRALYICYLSATEPLVETQVVAYLEGLATDGHEIHLLTFETADQSAEQTASRNLVLQRRGITWHRLRYHKKPSLPATIYDVIAGTYRGLRLIRLHKIDVVHARNHVPAAMALLLRRLTGCKLIFDIRGLMAEEYADALIWKTGSLAFRLTKRVERACISSAAGVVVLTHAVKRHLFAEADDAGERPVIVIPTTADVRGINRQRDRRDEIRQVLDIQNERVLVYLGKFSTWYMAREMAQFFKVSLTQRPNDVWMVLTQSDPALIRAELARESVPKARYRILRVSPSEVGAYLAAADYAISFIRPSFSKISSSPTKIGEYMAAGLPAVIGGGIGDTDPLIEGSNTGVIIRSHDERTYRRALPEVEQLLLDPATRSRCEQVAQEEFSLDGVGIPRYRRLYREVESRISR